MAPSINRRDFLQIGTTVLAAGSMDAGGSLRAQGDLLRTDLALNRPVMVSSVFYGPYQGAFAVDGCPYSWWASAPADPQFLTVDLQAICSVDSVLVAFIHELGDPAPRRTRWTPAHEELAGFATHYAIQVSTDARRWKAVFRTGSGNGGTLKLAFQPLPARYVRLRVFARSWRQWGVGVRHFSVFGSCRTPRPVPAGWTATPPATAVAPPETPAMNDDQSFAAGWRLAMAGPGGTAADGRAISRAGFDDRRWRPAKVPGTVLASLVAAGVFPDPLFGLNNLQIPEALNKYKWWYRREFKATVEKSRRLWLHVDGINYAAEFWLNGRQAGVLTGAFIRGMFDVTELLDRNDNANALAVCAAPVPNPGLPNEKAWNVNASINGGEPTRAGPNFFCTVGWDWICGIRDRCTGIWDRIYFRQTGPVTIANPAVTTDMDIPDVSRAVLEIKLDVCNHSGARQTGTLHAATDGIKLSRKISLQPGETRGVTLTAADYPDLVVKNPRLWWPNGYGEPNLYQLKLEFVVDNAVSDEKEIEFGIRKFTYDKRPELIILCNGKPIFVRGGDWGLDDAMKNLSSDRVLAWMRMHQLANLNMIRNWTGESNSEEFFRQCDRHGIMVWTEFWMANPADGPAPDDPGVVIANAKDTILRYRHHACIAIWCGRNEGPPPAYINSALSGMIRELDPGRYYQPGSSFAGVLSGGPYCHVDPSFYFGAGCNGFKTEIGTVSVPTLESLQQSMQEKDLWPPVTDVWAYHDFARLGAQNVMTYLTAINAQFGPSTDAADWNRKAQMLNYSGYRALFEGYAHKLWKGASGVITWMSHPAQRSTVWQLYAHDLEAHASLYGAKKGCEPLHVQLDPLDDSVEIINTTLQAVPRAAVRADIFAMDGKLIHSVDSVLDIAENARTPAMKIQVPVPLPAVWFTRLELYDNAGRLLADNTYWRASRPRDFQEMSLMEPVRPIGVCELHRSHHRTWMIVKLRHDQSVPAVMIKLTPRYKGGRILPAFISDNYFTMFHGQSKTIRIDFNAGAPLDAADIPAVEISGWNIMTHTAIASGGKFAGAAVDRRHWQIGPFVRPADGKPIITHDKSAVFRDPVDGKEVPWEFSHTFNPAAVVHNGKVYVLYRAEDNTGKGIGQYTSRIGLAWSADGLKFHTLPQPVMYPQPGPYEHDEWPGGCEDPRVVQSPDGTFVMTFTGWNRKIPRLCAATSRDLHHWIHHGPVFREAWGGKYLNFGCKSGSIVTERRNGRIRAVRVNGRYWMYWLNGNTAGIARSKDLLQWEPLLDEFNGLARVLQPRAGRFDASLTEPGPPALLTKAGIVLIYNGFDGRAGAAPYAAGQALFDGSDPARLIARCADPFFRPELSWEKHGQYAGGTTFTEGLVWFRNRWQIFYGAADTCVGTALGPIRGK